jgi:hypothetical protein
MEVEGGLRLVGGGRTEELRLRRRQVEEPVSERIHLSWIRGHFLTKVKRKSRHEYRDDKPISL